MHCRLNMMKLRCQEGCTVPVRVNTRSTDITAGLKDITELFYDTGIGKEGYSIIGQGQIDKILSGKAGRTP